jgi:adenine-specific DNA-methyltransferase
MRYYGGKSKLLEFIAEVADQEVPGHEKLSDLFAGTGVVGSHFRKMGNIVHANDILYFSYCLNVLSLSLDKGMEWEAFGGLENVTTVLNELEGQKGFITTQFSPSGSASRAYFSIFNAMKIDAIRSQIEEWALAGTISELEKAALIGLLLKAINRVSNVTGTYAAYLKTWDARALKPLLLDASDAALEGPTGLVTNSDIFDLDMTHRAQIAYLDPPYNHRDYASNYFLLEVIATGWFNNEFTPRGVTGMVKFQEKKSTFSSKRSVEDAFRKLFEHLNSEVTLLSYSDEGLFPIPNLLSMMSDYGEVSDVQKSHKRYRSINQDGSNHKLLEHVLVLRRR